METRRVPMRGAVERHYLVACDFDQTLSFNDSGIVLSELIGTSGFREKVVGLSGVHLVQQGAELAYLLRHDPELRHVRREHLIEAGLQEWEKARTDWLTIREPSGSGDMVTG